MSDKLKKRGNFLAFWCTSGCPLKVLTHAKGRSQRANRMWAYRLKKRRKQVNFHFVKAVLSVPKSFCCQKFPPKKIGWRLVQSKCYNGKIQNVTFKSTNTQHHEKVVIIAEHQKLKTWKWTNLLWTWVSVVPWLTTWIPMFLSCDHRVFEDWSNRVDECQHGVILLK